MSKHPFIDMAGALAREGQANERLKARVAELEQAFRSYAQHDDQCRAMSYGDSQCTCGYSTVLRTLSPE